MHVFGAAIFALVATYASAEVYFKETFSKGWEDRWVEGSENKPGQMGEWKWTAGQWYADKNDKGIQTGQDARFYSLSADMGTEIRNEGDDLVIQFSVKHEQKIDCGGAYIKLLPPGFDQKKFGGDTDYAIMFGPDICGTGTRKTHAIFTYRGENLLTKKTIRCETDQLSHLYTLIVRPDNTYEVRIDNEKVESGSLFDDWDFLPPKQIKDPSKSKPSDWVDEAKIPDPAAVKPSDWDDEPAMIPDPEAEKPDDWDDEVDGEWEPPMIDNPDYKGEWEAPLIDNPDYKGPWVHPMIDNPDYFEDDKVHAVCNPCTHVGFEIWQVKAGTIFDDILITNDVAEAEAAAADFEKKQETEKEMFDEIEAEKRRKAEEERKKAEEEAEDEDEEVRTLLPTPNAFCPS